MAKTAAQRTADAKAKRDELINKGYPSNPARLSQSGRALVADNLSAAGEYNLSQTIRLSGPESGGTVAYGVSAPGPKGKKMKNKNGIWK